MSTEDVKMLFLKIILAAGWVIGVFGGTITIVEAREDIGDILRELWRPFNNLF
ncbi:MAG: hypothetical protein OXP69_14610 [Spirochaetaceae bacterium]|nr:hypothetical protein [Spirochaetaceae bacterium]